VANKGVFNGTGIGGINHPGAVTDHDVKAGIDEFQPDAVEPEVCLIIQGAFNGRFLGNQLQSAQLYECDREKKFFHVGWSLGYLPGWGKHLIMTDNPKVMEKNQESK
jgi:hypothetical protein